MRLAVLQLLNCNQESKQNIMLSVNYTYCRNAVRRYAKSRYAKCH